MEQFGCTLVTDSRARCGMTNPIKISVLLSPEEAARFEAYCDERGYKKSTLIARLIREYLDRERFTVQMDMFGEQMPKRQAS